jgi:uncharacterized protein YndB with AHSA1/START domain
MTMRIRHSSNGGATMTIIAIVLGIIAVLIAGVVVLALGKPDTYRIERSAFIAAPAPRIFAEINDLAAWRAWSPWEKKDPNMKRELSATTVGKGATYAWSGDKNVGSGRMTVIDATPDSRVLIRLDFEEPFASTADAEFLLTPEGGGTRVSWAMTGQNYFVSKIMNVFFDMDKMIGVDFEAGLAELKKKAEKAA